VGGAKSGRGGRALLAGLLSCGRCGRRLMVSYAPLAAPGRSSLPRRRPRRSPARGPRGPAAADRDGSSSRSAARTGPVAAP
jgi:hypothetical protein